MKSIGLTNRHRRLWNTPHTQLSPGSHSIGGPQPELCMRSRLKLVHKLVLLGLLRNQLLPLTFALVPFQFVLSNRRPVVRWSIPPQGQVSLASVGHFGREGLWRMFSRYFNATAWQNSCLWSISWKHNMNTTYLERSLLLLFPDKQPPWNGECDPKSIVWQVQQM